MTSPTAVPSVLNLDNEAEDTEPSCTFILDGQDWKCRNGEDVSWEMVSNLYTAGDEGGAYMAKVSEFFRAVIVSDQWEDFAKLMAKPGSPLTVRRASALVPFLMENVLGIPTEPPKPVSPGRPKTGSKSRARSSATGTRRKAS